MSVIKKDLLTATDYWNLSVSWFELLPKAHRAYVTYWEWHHWYNLLVYTAKIDEESDDE